jgi:hypothetical protein
MRSLKNRSALDSSARFGSLTSVAFFQVSGNGNRKILVSSILLRSACWRGWPVFSVADSSSPLRIISLLVVIHETLAHLRYIDVMALVAPFFIARPLAQHFSQCLRVSIFFSR